VTAIESSGRENKLNSEGERTACKHFTQPTCMGIKVASIQRLSYDDGFTLYEENARSECGEGKHNSDA
jgi:hypothetical protein